MDQQLKRLSTQVNHLTQTRVDTLSQREKQDLMNTLTHSRDLLLGVVAPAPTPTPLPPARQSCQNTRGAELANAIGVIANFASDSFDGLGMTSRNAADYAQEWVQNFACEDAQMFAHEGKRFMSFARDSFTGLGMTTFSARAYVTQNLPNVCIGDSYEEKFQMFFTVARNDLRMTTSRARDYALEQISTDLLGCSEFAL